MSKEAKVVETMSLEEFFGSEKVLAISCKTKEQSEILLKAFHEMGKTWRSGESYVEKSKWEVYSAETCYDNKGYFADKNFFKYEKWEIIDFKNIDFSKNKLTAKEITKWILENCVDKSGNVILQDLDFGNKNVYIHNLKTTGSLIQSNQKVGGDLMQGNQKVGGNLFQNCQKVGGDLIQANQIVSGNLYSHKLDQNEVWEENFNYVVRKKVLKPITRKELAEMGFEIKD